jgi:hypothetical protein
MRKVTVWGLVLVATAVIFTAAQGYTPILLEPPTHAASQVEVTNFPPVQPVNGTVQVGNLPAVQTVGGPVTVSNLPAVQTVTGSVQVTNLPAARIHVAGITAATFVFVNTANPGLLTLSRACDAEFPGARMCTVDELAMAIPPPPEWTDRVYVMRTDVPPEPIPACYRSPGFADACDGPSSDIPGIHSALCCGF